MGRRFLIWGGGGHGKVVADLIRDTGAEVVGFVDADPDKLGSVVEPGGARVLCSESAFFKAMSENMLPHEADAIALAVGDNGLRCRAIELVPQTWLPPLVHSTATVSRSARVGAGSVVFARAVINAAASLGDAVIVNTGVIVEHDCSVSAGCHLSPGAVLAGGVRVGERSWIGAGAIVIQGVDIGADSIIGAGAVVIRDVPSGTTAVGVPARSVERGTSG